GAHGCERHRIGHRLERLDVDAHELSLLVGRIRIGLADHLDDADDAFLVAGVIEEPTLATLHVFEMAARAEIAHAGPRLALFPLPPLMPPAEALGLCLQQPVRHSSPPLSGRPSESGDP